MNALADELLRIILGPFFDVPEADFAYNGSVSPFSKVPQSVAELLRVCKRWMRFATPLLYSTVVIRTRAQAAALNMALTNNTEFGGYVRRLRLEGVFGEFITPDVINIMPNVRQMCFPINMLAKDDTDGLLAAFELFHLERVVLLSLPQYRYLQNGAINQFIANLANAIPTWHNLKHFTFPQSNAPQDASAIKIIGSAVCLSPNLKTVTIGLETIVDQLRAQLGVAACFDLLQKPGLEHFIVQGMADASPRQARGIFARFPVDVRLRARAVSRQFCGTSFAERSMARPTNQFWLPMFDMSEEKRLRIWTIIIKFALMQDSNAPNGYQRSWWEYAWNRRLQDEFDMVTGGACLRVSKEFNLATHRVIDADVRLIANGTYAPAPSYTHSLGRDPNLPSFIRSIQFSWGYGAARGPTLAEIKPTKLDRMTALEQVVLENCAEHGLRLVWPILRQASGSNLTRLAIKYAGPEVDFQEDVLFGGLENLKELYLHLRRMNSQARADRTHEKYLPRLEVFHIGCLEPGLYATITRQALPCLRAVFLSQYSPGAVAFLIKHGAKITHLGLADKMYTQDVFDAVPNVTTLAIDPSAVPRCLATVSHSCVSLITLSWYSYGAGRFKVLADYMSRKVKDGEWPSLRRITVTKHTQDGLWPLDERAAKRSPWPKMANLLASVGVSLTDCSGLEWRERLRWTEDEDGTENLPPPITRLRSGMKSVVETSVADEIEAAQVEEEENQSHSLALAGSSRRIGLRGKRTASPSAVVAPAASPPLKSSRRRGSKRAAASKR